MVVTYPSQKGSAAPLDEGQVHHGDDDATLYQETALSFFRLTASTLAIAAFSATTAAARDQVQVAGSSTVLPYAAIVAEAFGENFEFPTSVVESGGSSAGLKRFC